MLTMGTNSLRHFLQSLCGTSPWIYAVFWKLEHQCEETLVWEDGYCDNPGLRRSTGGLADELYIENYNKFINSKSSMHDENLCEHPVVLAVAEMSNTYHLVGKGVVGDVALTGNARWIFSDHISTDGFSSNSVSEDGWLFQFLAGIKTILLAPILPYGVLQLGSLDMVAEDAATIALIRDKFDAHNTFNPLFLSVDSESLFQPIMSSLMDNLEESAMATSMSEDRKAGDALGAKGFIFSTAKQMDTVQDSVQKPFNASSNISADMMQNEYHKQSFGIHFAGPLSYQSSDGNKQDMKIGNSSTSDYPEQDVCTFPYFNNNYNMKLSGESAKEVPDFHTDSSAAEDHYSTISKNGSSLLSFPSDGELHKALGPAFLDNINKYLGGSYNPGCNGDQSSLYNSRTVSGMGLSNEGFREFPFKEEHGKRLLDAVIDNACTSSDHNSSNQTSSGNTFNNSSGEFVPSSQKPTLSGQSTLVDEHVFPWSFQSSLFVPKGASAVTNSSPSVSSLNCVAGDLIQNQQQRKGHGSLNLGSGTKLSSAYKRKSRLGSNPKPRPRDRQLIQDRLKALRELIPNGAKCSIDGLLDKTIKHMMFLKNVTDQANTLKQNGLKEEIDESEVNSGHSSGVSWAVELGDDEQVCPIVVKDLDPPGSILIEMLCDDHGHYLEIADVIHRLELTILKGVFKQRSGNRWAHFVVQAPKDFHRLDIFWPLMQLLQQNRTPISSKI